MQYILPRSSGGTIPSAQQASTSVVTSATTTYVTAITTTITTTGSSVPIYAVATAVLTTTTATSVAKYRITINGIAGQEQFLSLTATATNFTAAVEYISAALGPGTYTINFQIARNSGTGTVNFFQGTLDAIALQGASSNGITQLTGDVTAGPGSGSQVATIAAAAVTLAKMANLASTNIIVGNVSNRPTAVAMSADATLSNTGALTIANLAVTNAKIANTTINLTTKVTGILPGANGGTGVTMFAASRIPFSNGTTYAADSLLTYTSANTRFFVGAGGGNGRINGTVNTTDPVTTDIAGNFFSRGSNNCIQAQNENAWTLSLVNAGQTAVGAAVNLEASRGTLVARTQIQSGDVLGTINAQGYTGTTWNGFSGAIQFIATENTTTTNQGGDLVFSTTPNGAAAVVERIRITQAGHLKSTQASVPTIAADAGAGTGATASLAKATDIAGEITINTGTLGVSTGSYATITFNKACGVAPIIVLTPANGTLSSSVYVTSTTTTFSVNFAVAGGITSTYVINYHVLETQS